MDALVQMKITRSRIVLGVIIGAIFVQFTTWRWVFWFTAVLALPASAGAIFLIPSRLDESKGHRKRLAEKLHELDILGVMLLTVALVLFIFSLTTGSTGRWSQGIVIGPMIASAVLTAGFFYWESILPDDTAAL